MISTDASTNSIVLSVNDVGASFRSADFRYAESILVAKGSVEAKITSVSIQVKIALT